MSAHRFVSAALNTLTAMVPRLIIALFLAALSTVSQHCDRKVYATRTIPSTHYSEDQTLLNILRNLRQASVQPSAKNYGNLVADETHPSDGKLPRTGWWKVVLPQAVRKRHDVSSYNLNSFGLRVWGSELTINVKRNDSVTLMCSNHEVLELCICPPYTGGCNRCTGIKERASVKTSGRWVYYTLQGLEQRDSGQYVCSSSFTWTVGQVYKLNVLEGQDSTTVIGIVAQSIVMSCGAEQDIMAASEKHWCHLNNVGVCESDTVLDLENETWGDFKILDRNSSFSLEKQYLTHSDAGSYRLTMNFHSHTKVCEVKVQVRDEPRHLEIIPVQVDTKPGQHFEIN
ncbi:hypothetical protein INR49_031961 [Caranx melampygus]|nr:hypothetical protein INR49_031961 [Caranx melampygus]